MVVPIANLSAIVTGAMDEAMRASAAWVMHHLWAWLAVARAVAAESLPAVEASGPWVQTAAKLLHGLYGWLVTAAVEKLPDVAAEKLVGDAAAWFMRGHGTAVYATLALVLLAVAFLGGAVCALTCRAMKAPGLRGPRAVFEASPKRYYATVRSARRRGACGAGRRLLLPAGLVCAFLAYMAAKVL